MGIASRELHRNKRRKTLGKLHLFLDESDDSEFLQLCWCIDALRSGACNNLGKYLKYPKEAEGAEVGDPYFVPEWEIETLALMLLSNPILGQTRQRTRSVNCRTFDAAAYATNLLRSLENSESAVFLPSLSIFTELHRIAQRQFPWQRGFASSERLYRYAFIYGQGDCATHFEETHNIPVEAFLEACLTLYSWLKTVPWTKLPPVEHIDAEDLRKAVAIISKPLPEMRLLATELIEAANKPKQLPVAYLPSVLRQFPVITKPAQGLIISPLPELIVYRMTVGLYSDIRSGDQYLLNDANQRFEEYTRKLIEAFFADVSALEAEMYGPKKKRIDTPDVLVSKQEQVVAVIECKATKLTYDAQFGENPIEEAERAYSQIVKAVVQLWRFFSDVRREIYTQREVDRDAFGVVLTLDTWVQASKTLQDEIIAQAKEQLADNPDITEEDMRPVAFCHLQDLVDVMMVSTEEDFFLTFRNAIDPEFAGWGLLQVRNKVCGDKTIREFPLDVSDVLPWWGTYS